MLVYVVYSIRGTFHYLLNTIVLVLLFSFIMNSLHHVPVYSHAKTHVIKLLVSFSQILLPLKTVISTLVFPIYCNSNLVISLIQKQSICFQYIFQDFKILRNFSTRRYTYCEPCISCPVYEI